MVKKFDAENGIVVVTRDTITGEPNVNGHIYSRELIQEMINSYGEKSFIALPVMGVSERDTGTVEVDPLTLSGVTESIRFDEEGKLECTISLSMTSAGDLMKTLLQAGVDFSVGINGYGEEIKPNEISNFTPTSISLIPVDENPMEEELQA